MMLKNYKLTSRTYTSAVRIELESIIEAVWAIELHCATLIPVVVDIAVGAYRFTSLKYS